MAGVRWDWSQEQTRSAYPALGHQKKPPGERRAGVGKPSAKWPSGLRFERPRHYLVVGSHHHETVPNVVSADVTVATGRIRAVLRRGRQACVFDANMDRTAI